VTQCVTPRQTCLQPNGFRRNLRSKTRWFTGFCNSHQVSHFATFFIDARAEISVAESRSVIRKIADANTTRERAADARSFVRFFLGAFCAGVRCLTSRRTRCPEVPCASARRGKKWKARQLGHDPRIIPREYKLVRWFSAWQVFDNDPSAGSPTETLLRLLLPLNDKVQWTSRDVAGSEPPTSPRSEHFTGPFNR
jgi:hypothetical protein